MVADNGVMLVADRGNNRIQVGKKWAGTLAGNGSPSSSDGVGKSAGFSSPSAIALSGDGVVYVADTGNHSIRKI